ncbi:sigma-70 family RNA polymerase sigma factor [Novipirellula artificiosorum]|uniref:ECF RNA polymerase sigma factor SigW n=1 Tax=Novipirellula artificiosorum TaxID=2528016 RepID=A0A5C6DSS8_9BACT|nr:sigma-70 family RNA polymerase sigma factor [Novipirellula artificiosorum]TWU39780.1 ECF RNA polymerase sigma factor SigW [Novipirellula artificiosorum]
MSYTCPATDELSRRLSRGDRHALADLFTLYRDRLEQMLHFRVPAQLAGRLDIDDLLQESYLAAAKRIAAFEHSGEHSPLVWLRLITLQTLTDQCRRHLAAQRRDAGRELSIHARMTIPGATSASMASLLIGQWTSPSGVVMRAEAIQQLEDAIDSMEPIDREILALRHFEMLNNKETAAVLGITTDAASIRYVRAIRRLKEICTDECPESKP